MSICCTFSKLRRSLAVILFSAFTSNDGAIRASQTKASEAMQKSNPPWRKRRSGRGNRVEYLGKQTRELLKDNRSLCAEIFRDGSVELPIALSRLELAGIISATNKMRNDWSGHGGVVGQEEAQLRNERLLAEVQKVHDVMAETWTVTQLIQALNCRSRRGQFENEVAIIMGSNSEFLKERN